MSNKYVAKDPTVKSFIVGIVVFALIIAVGVFGIKKITGKNNNQQQGNGEIAITDNKKDNSEQQFKTPVQENNNKSEEEQNSLQNEKNQPKKITKVGSDLNIKSMLSAMAITYVLVYLAQKKFIK